MKVNRAVIVLSIRKANEKAGTAAPAYYIDSRSSWDGSWYSRKIGEAKVFRSEARARMVIAEFGSSWEGLAPTVVDPATIEGYMAPERRPAREVAGR